MPTAYTVSNLDDSGAGSLRAAITSVNGDTTPDAINFSVAGVIKLTSAALPTITNTVDIYGTSAPGFANSPVVEIDNNGFAGLDIGAPNSTLASLSIVNANGPGVTLTGFTSHLGSGGANDCTVVGNYIGLALDGSIAANSGVGLFVDGTGGQTIGGTSPVDRNVISGNGAGGIQVGASGHGGGVGGTISGNFIGTDPTGTVAAPNQGNGITLFSGPEGVDFYGGTTVGGTDPGDGNTIAFNSQYGVDDEGESNTIRENSIFNNGSGGILPTTALNHPAPVLTAAIQPTPTTIEVSGAINVATSQFVENQSYVVEFFATPVGTPTGQGQNYIGSLTVVPNTAGVTTFVFRSTFASSSGNSITATVTSPAATSAFSQAVALGGNANTVFVGNAYLLLVNRAPDPGGAAYWTDQLNNGASTPVGVVLGIEGSAEYIADEIDAMYLRYLQRAADPEGQQYWVSFVQAGGTFEQVAEGMVTTQVYYAMHGGTDQGYIAGLYMDVLNRSASASELAGWEMALDSGASRASVANAFLTSQEYRSNLVQADYMTFLLRAADPGGLAYWVNALGAGSTDQEVLAQLFGSAEGYDIWS
ncbi:MAG TPA: DUF4214 domain-containing protein [Pirellulales bacterium]|nr:DUF4214 domain-containing protein [Pirellulales bacterium]